MNEKPNPFSVPNLLKALVVTFSLAVLFTPLKTIQNYFVQSAQFNPYPATDEGFALEAIRRSFEGGYKAEPCHFGCYGGAQDTLDALSLHFFSKDWLGQNKAFFPWGRWLWIAEHPHMLSAIRLLRVGSMALVLGLVFLWGFSNAGIAIFPMLAILARSPYFLTVQGVKPDINAGLCMIIFLVLCRRWIFGADWLERRKWFMASFLFAVFSFSIKPNNSLVLAFTIPFFIFLETWHKTKLRKSLPLLAFALSFGFALHILLNPSSLLSFKEAQWFTQFFKMAGTKAHISWSIRLKEIFILADLMAILMPFLYLTWDWKRFDRTKIIQFSFFVAVIFLLSAPFVFSAYGRAYYYLPAILAGIFLLIEMLRQMPEKTLPVALLLSLTGILLFGARSLRPELAEPVIPLYADSREEIFAKQLLANPNQAWHIDMAARPYLPDELKTRQNLKFFDSVSTSPAELLPQLEPGSKVLFSCWSISSQAQKVLASTLASLQEWAKIGNTICKETCDALECNPTVLYARNTKSMVITAEALQGSLKSQGLAILPLPQLNPRALNGALYGVGETQKLRVIETGIAPYRGPATEMQILHPPFKLTGNFKVPRSIASVAFTMASNCKLPGQVSFGFSNSNGKNSASLAVNSSTEDFFCKDFPRLCHYAPPDLAEGFKKWLNRSYSDGGKIVPISVREGESLRISVTAAASPIEACDIALGPFRFSP